MTEPRFTAPEAPDEHDSERHGERPIREDLHELLGRVQEVLEYGSYWVSIQGELIKLRVRKAAIGIALGVVGGLALVAVIVTSVVMGLNGLAGALASAFWPRPWLGELVLGFGVLVLLAVGMLVGKSILARSSARKTIARHEQRRAKERARFGHDVLSRAEDVTHASG